jgi:hypothetical protein
LGLCHPRHNKDEKLAETPQTLGILLAIGKLLPQGLIPTHIPNLNHISESSHRRQHEYLCGCERDQDAPEVSTEWVGYKISPFISPSMPLPQSGIDFQGSRVTSDGGLVLVRELDERLGFGGLIKRLYRDSPSWQLISVEFANLHSFVPDSAHFWQCRFRTPCVFIEITASFSDFRGFVVSCVVTYRNI